ncbi:unnamed protein product [Mytilus coruscus]|uniref:VWFD domain-containing protein n=1 Tax=Mytilus coruscus TaxID=42192 RepID=A0A6J8AGL8_MYTCO|nr:unnamed protein product [Mytilus coruscus]
MSTYFVWRLAFINVFMKMVCTQDHPLLFVAKVFDVSLVNLNNGDSEVIVDGLSRSFMLDYHYSSGFLYWIDIAHATISRICYPSKNENPPELIIPKESGHRPTDIVIDYIHNHIYWADSYDFSILRSELDGSDKKTILKDNAISEIRGIAMDVLNGIIYFTDRNAGKIEKLKLDNTSRNTIIANPDAINPVHMDLDINEGRFYWTDVGLHQIKSATFDGNDIKTIVSGRYPYGIQIYGDYIYYSQWENGQIWRVKKSGLTADLLYTTTTDVLGIKVFEENTYCQTFQQIQNSNKRSAGYMIDLAKGVPTSDHTLERGWYRVMSDNGDEIPNYPPGLGYCGTLHPIWLNGTLPSVDDQNVTREACLQTQEDECEEKIDIQIRNCGGFYMYYLQHTPINSSFCFGKGPVLCPKRQSSETGYYPGCTSSFPNETFHVEVVSELIQHRSFPIPGYDPTPSLVPVFRCKFDDVSNSSFLYDIHWFINGDNVTRHLNMAFEDINSTILRDTDWNKLYNMNMMVECAVRARYLLGSTPGPYIYSPQFQAGIFPEKYEYSVVEGSSVDIILKSTVPVGCIASHYDIRKHCEQNFYIFQPKKDQTSLSCIDKSIAKKDIVFEAKFCGVSVKSMDWQEAKKLHVIGYSDGMYNFQDRSTIISISTSAVSDLNDIWKDVQVPDIKITVIDKDSVLINRQCRSYNDPHITTFDGRLYHYMNVGEFVMYKNDKGPYLVHALFTNCGFGWAGSSCHCGIAVRSRNSLFVLRTCQTISRTEKHLLQEPITKLISCDEKDLLIEHDTNNYKITLPIGTKIKFTISRWSKFISMIAIKPSVFDINEASGLCGVPSTTKDMSDDFTHRQNGPIENDQDFADSWRITPSMFEEQLFNNEAIFQSNSVAGNGNAVTENNFTRYCTCERQASSTIPLDDFNTVHCNLTESTEFCSESSITEEDTITSFYTSCSISKRKRRSVNSGDKIVRRSISKDDDVIDFPQLTYDDSVFNNEVTTTSTFRNGWTEETALLACMADIQNALPSELTNLVDVSVSEFVESCVLDIKLVGDTTFLPDTISTMLNYIMTEVLRNESLYILNTTDGSQTLVEYVTSLMCPNNCNDNGNCTLGVCMCSGKYIGDDCSQSISIPPSNTSLPFDGLCTLGTRDCRSTNMYGNFLSRIVWYKLKYFQIITDSIRYISEGALFEANFRNIFMVSIDLESSRRKRATSETFMAEGYEISLSYDGTNFGESTRIIIYDETCYSCNSTSIECVQLDFCNPTVAPTTQNEQKSFQINKKESGAFILNRAPEARFG